MCAHHMSKQMNKISYAFIMMNHGHKEEIKCFVDKNDGHENLSLQASFIIKTFFFNKLQRKSSSKLLKS